MSYEFCPRCGSLKERKQICKVCSKIIKTPERTERIQKDLSFRKALNKKKLLIKENSIIKKKAQPKHFARYSESGGIEYFFEIDPDVKRTRLNFCVKCKQNKPCYAGWWVRAGGKNAPENTRKRIFICSDCWRPNKEKNDN